MERSAFTGADPGADVGPNMQLDSKTVRSQIKIHSPMIIIISAHVPQPGCYAQDPDGYRQIYLDWSVVGPKTD